MTPPALQRSHSNLFQVSGDLLPRGAEGGLLRLQRLHKPVLEDLKLGSGGLGAGRGGWRIVRKGGRSPLV